MSEHAIEFLQEWIATEVDKAATPSAEELKAETPEAKEMQAESLVRKCVADAAKADVALDEIVEEVGDLEELMLSHLEDKANGATTTKTTPSPSSR